MASTYSTSLRLELMATGDQSGTWGDTTNTNLGTLLEQAITGVLSVAQGDTTLTLTNLNGASDQARNAVVNLTGAMTANRNVIVPDPNKLYLVKNSTTGGFSVVVKTSAGSGVTIPPGTARWVYADGTNVVDGLTGNQAANAFVPGYTTTATAAGTTVLTVASTQTQYFTGTSTQTITLPVTSTLVLGQEYEIVNLSTGSLTVNSSGGNLVATVLAGNTVRVQVILTSGTSAASWNSIAASIPNPLTLTGATAGYTPLNLVSTEAGAAAGPILNLYRDSATPAASDILGQVLFNGEDSAGNKQEYAAIEAVITDPTSASEDATLNFYTQVAGVRTLALTLPQAASGRAIGELVFHSGPTVPALCLAPFGQNVSRTTYAAYFAEVGTTYGAGDGSTTFTMPDYRGRVIAGKDNMGGTSANRLTNQSGGLDGDVLGATGGAETHTLTTAQLAAHTHTFAAGLAPNSSQGFSGGGSAYGSGSTATSSTGSGSAHNNVQPTAIANIAIYVGV